MQLNESGLSVRKQWKAAGYLIPEFDRSDVAEKTRKRPYWIHFGAGNIFRAFQANVVQNLLNKGVLDRGLIVAEGYDYEIVEKMNRPHDDYSILVTLKANGFVEKTVIGSVVQSFILDSGNTKEFDGIKAIFRQDSLQMASFTITEKGYSLTDAKGMLLSSVACDMERGPEKPESYIGKIASLLYARFLAGERPIAMVSMDNCSHNGTKLFEAVSAFADAWSERDLTEKAFSDYIHNPKKVSFPWSMIDKITPRPDPSVENILKKDDVEGLAPIITSKRTYVAPFVNAEECEYLVIEDAFPNGRPPLEKGGILFTTRETVDKVEKMKVCTCLNPLHTALAIFGCLLGYDLIFIEMRDAALRRLAEGVGKEGLPVAVHPGILDPKEFMDTVLNIRLPNPFMPDTPQRIATDTSQKLAIRFGETIKAYAASPKLRIADLKLIPLVFAGWLRYLMGLDDDGNVFELSPDPILSSVCSYVASIRLGDHGVDTEARLKPILENEKIFGVNLYDVNMAGTICGYFKQMISGTGAVRAVLEKYV